MEINKQFSHAMAICDFEQAKDIYSKNTNIKLYLNSCWDAWGGDGILRKFNDIQEHLYSFESLETIEWFSEMIKTITIYDTEVDKYDERKDYVYTIYVDREFICNFDDDLSLLYKAIEQGQTDVVKYIIITYKVNINKIILHLCNHQLIEVKFFWEIVQGMNTEEDINIPLKTFIVECNNIEAVKWYHSVNPFTDQEIDQVIVKLIKKYYSNKKYIPQKILGKIIHLNRLHY